MSEQIKPFSSFLPKEPQIRRMFDDIAFRYDLLNRILSLRKDIYWRRVLVNEVLPLRPTRLLDVATGTGDLAWAFAKARVPEVVGIDISKKMLEKARARSVKGVQPPQFVEGSALDLPFKDDAFDVVTVAFGVRNFENVALGLREMHRVTRPGGGLFVLEFSTPSSPLWRNVVNMYNRFVVPGLGACLAGHYAAYRYLYESVAAFPSGAAFCRILEDNGWRKPVPRPLSHGVVTLYRAIK